MKTTVTVAVIVAILAIGAGWSNHYINTSAATMVQELDQMDNQIKNGGWEQAKSQLDTLEKEWEKTKNVWSGLVTHQEIDNIDVSLQRLKEYIDNQSTVLATSELATFRLLVEHIADTESLSFKNIL